MGFKVSDFTPTQFSAVTPSGKDIQVKAFQVARTDTTAALKMMLPADASILDFTISGVASDALTTAVVSIGSTSTSTEYVPSADVKGGGTFIRPTVTGTAVVQTEALPLGSDLPVYAKYAETGTASTVGGPWKVVVYFTR